MLTAVHTYLQTARVTLRRFTADDADLLIELDSDPAVMRFLSGGAPTGPDEIRKEGTGMYAYSEGGRRFLPGTWTTDERAFDKNGAVTIYESRPPGEVPKDYPSPAANGGRGGSTSSSSSSG